MQEKKEEKDFLATSYSYPTVIFISISASNTQNMSNFLSIHLGLIGSQEKTGRSQNHSQVNWYKLINLETKKQILIENKSFLN